MLDFLVEGLVDVHKAEEGMEEDQKIGFIDRYAQNLEMEHENVVRDSILIFRDPVSQLEVTLGIEILIIISQEEEVFKDIILTLVHQISVHLTTYLRMLDTILTLHNNRKMVLMVPTTKAHFKLNTFKTLHIWLLFILFLIYLGMHIVVQ